MVRRSASSVLLAVWLVWPAGCSDDDSSGDGPADTTAVSTTTGTDATSGGSASAGTTTQADTSTSDGGSTTETPMGTMVGSCDECVVDELCMVLTEYAGPADGGPPPMTSFCFPLPGSCGGQVDCRCAGHLCPDEAGAEATCTVFEGVLQCAVAYP